MNFGDSPVARIPRAGFYIAVILFFYGTLFPFQFDCSPQALSSALSQTGWLPFWDPDRHRIHSLPDMIANFLLTLPLGFFGTLVFGRGRKSQVAVWAAVGFGFGIFSEVMQLAIPSRSSHVTDALNNGLGALAGAWVALVLGRRALDFVSGLVLDREATHLWLVLFVVTCAMLAPFDIGLDVSHFRASARKILTDPWQESTPVGDGWVIMAELAIFGALAGQRIRSGKFFGRISRRGSAAGVLLLPFLLEAAQILFASHYPGLRSYLMETAAVGLGLLIGLRLRIFVRPSAGLVILTLGLIASGLSPYEFAKSHRAFQWIPLVEYYDHTSASALADAMTAIGNYALLGGLLCLSARLPRYAVVFLSGTIAFVIEFAQLFIATRYAGATDVLIAALGAWTGDVICRNLERNN